MQVRITSTKKTLLTVPLPSDWKQLTNWDTKVADYWINVGMASTLDELKTVNPKFVDAKAVREKTVYNNNLRTTPDRR